MSKRTWLIHAYRDEVPTGDLAEIDAIRFAELTEAQVDGCHLWTGDLTPDGYGNFYAGVEKDTIRAHRYAWTKANGPLDRSIDLDHLCHSATACAGGVECPHRRCVNVAHLEPVTRKENLRRGLLSRLGPDHMTLLDAASFLGLAKTTAYRMADDGRFPVPVEREGRLIKVRKADVAALLDGRAA